MDLLKFYHGSQSQEDQFPYHPSQVVHPKQQDKMKIDSPEKGEHDFDNTEEVEHWVGKGDSDSDEMKIGPPEKDEATFHTKDEATFNTIDEADGFCQKNKTNLPKEGVFISTETTAVKTRINEMLKLVREKQNLLNTKQREVCEIIFNQDVIMIQPKKGYAASPGHSPLQLKIKIKYYCYLKSFYDSIVERDETFNISPGRLDSASTDSSRNKRTVTGFAATDSSAGSTDNVVEMMHEIKKIVDEENKRVFETKLEPFDHVRRFFEGDNQVCAFNPYMRGFTDDSDYIRIAFLCLDGNDLFSAHFKTMEDHENSKYKEAFERMTYKLTSPNGGTTTLYGSDGKVSISSLHANACTLVVYYFGGKSSSFAKKIYDGILKNFSSNFSSKKITECEHFTTFKTQLDLITPAEIRSFLDAKITRITLPYSEVQDIQAHIRILVVSMLGIITFVEINLDENPLIKISISPHILAMKKLVYCLMLAVHVKEVLDSLVLNDHNDWSKLIEIGVSYDQIAACKSNVPVITRQKIKTHRDKEQDMTFLYMNHSTGALMISILYKEEIDRIIPRYRGVSEKMTTAIDKLFELMELGRAAGSYLNIIKNDELKTKMDQFVGELKTLLEERDTEGKTTWEYLIYASEQVSQSAMKKYESLDETSFLLVLRVADHIYRANGGSNPLNSELFNSDSSYHDLKELLHYRSLAVAHIGFAFVANHFCSILGIDPLLHVEEASLIYAINSEMKANESSPGKNQLFLHIHDTCIKKIKQDFSLLVKSEMPTFDQIVKTFDDLAKNPDITIKKFIEKTDTEITKHVKKYWSVDVRDIDSRIIFFMSFNVWSILTYTDINNLCLVPFQIAKLISCIRFVGGADKNQQEAFTRAPRDKVFKTRSGNFLVFPCTDPYVTTVEETSPDINMKHVHLYEGIETTISCAFDCLFRVDSPAVCHAYDMDTKRNPDPVCSNVGFPSLADAAGNPESQLRVACESLRRQFLIAPRNLACGLTLPKSGKFVEKLVEKKPYSAVELLSVNMVGFLDEPNFPTIKSSNYSNTFSRLNDEFIRVLETHRAYLTELEDEITDLETMINEKLAQQKQTEFLIKEYSNEMSVEEDQPKNQLVGIDELNQLQETNKSEIKKLRLEHSKCSEDYEDTRKFYNDVDSKLHDFIKHLKEYVDDGHPDKFFSDEIYTLSYEVSRIVNLQKQQQNQMPLGIIFHAKLVNAFCRSFFEKSRFSQIEVNAIDTTKRSRIKKGGAPKFLDSYNKLPELGSTTYSDSEKSDISLTPINHSEKFKLESSPAVQRDQVPTQTNNDLSFDEITDENGDVFFVAEYGFYMDYAKIDPDDENSEMQLMMFPIKTEEQLAEVRERFKALHPDTHIGGKGRRANRDAIKLKKTKKRAPSTPLKRVTKNKNKNKKNKNNNNKSGNNKSGNNNKKSEKKKKNKKNHHNDRKKTRR